MISLVTLASPQSASLDRSDDHDRAVCMAGAVVTGRAHQEVRQRVVSTGAEHEQIGVGAVANQDVWGVAGNDHWPCGHIGVAEFCVDELSAQRDEFPGRRSDELGAEMLPVNGVNGVQVGVAKTGFLGSHDQGVASRR